jgi:hypothetical protein
MPVSTVTALLHPQWRMMNLLNPRTGRPATPTLSRCDATIDDLIALHERELITGRIGDDQVDLGLLAHDRGLLDSYDIAILLTAGGVQWVERNPSNRALVAIDTISGRKPAKMTEVMAAADVDAGLFLLLDHAGLVTFSLASGADIRPVGTITLVSYRQSLMVQLTHKAVEIIG